MADFPVTDGDTLLGTETALAEADYERSGADTVSASETSDVVFLKGLFVSSASSTKANAVVVLFNAPALSDAELINPGNYVITPISAGAVTVIVQSVELPQGQTDPLFVGLVVSDMTGGATYTVSLSSDITSAGGEPALPIAAQLIAFGDNPTVFVVLAESINSARVIFSKVMRDNADIRNPLNYFFDNGLVTTAVTEVAGSVVTLATNDQVPGFLYSLLIIGLADFEVEGGDTVSASESQAVVFP